MGELRSRLDALGKRCRHYDARNSIVDPEKTCGIGHPIRKIVKAAAGTDLGMAFMLPCHPGPERKADCPSYDPKTDEEIAADKLRMKAATEKFIERLPKIAAMKRKMVKHELSFAKATCPWCEVKDALHLTCALSVNNHVHGKCSKCGQGFME